jgi:hypothetical protein
MLLEPNASFQNSNESSSHGFLFLFILCMKQGKANNIKGSGAKTLRHLQVISKSWKYCYYQSRKGMVFSMEKQNLFKWKHYQPDIILLTVRWYLQYNLSFRNLVEMMEE